LRVERVEFRVSGKFRVESWGLAWMFLGGAFLGEKIIEKLLVRVKTLWKIN
jgi:hypothetical protein